VDHDAGVRQREAHALFTGRQQQTAHRGGLADDQGGDLGADVLHSVVDRQTAGHNAARAVDIHGDFLGGILGLKEQKLRADQAGHAVMHRARKENDPLFEHAGEDVIGPFAAAGLFDHHRDKGVHVEVYGIAHGNLPVVR
jgi:hypothetical protein